MRHLEDLAGRAANLAMAVAAQEVCDENAAVCHHYTHPPWRHYCLLVWLVHG